MKLDTLLLIVFILILLEYNLRLKREIERRAEKRFEEMKRQFLTKGKVNKGKNKNKEKD
jgi:Tfp pilus assembly protein PilO